jgi:predicted ATPase/transcriptional regulator with XRE-family HTH domain
MEGTRTFGQWVKNRRKALGLTQAHLAQRASCSKSMINKIESDLRSPAKPLVELLAVHLKISSADYPDFVHLAQPYLSVAPDDLLYKEGANAVKTFPTPITPLIGRAHDVAEVSSYLQQTGIRLLTLTGPGGIGKTRLALQVAAELKDKFADGVYFVSLAPVRDTAHVLSAIVQALGLKSTHDQRDNELLLAYLQEKATLLVLDNFEQALPAAKAITELLMFTSYVKVLVTSRVVLRLSGEREFVVPPLDIPDRNLAADPTTLAHSPAAQLFVQRAQAIRAGFILTAENAHSVAEICSRLDGLPLAIELAAARCKALSPQAILVRLTSDGGALALLAGGARDLPARQQTIRLTIEWSYNLLNELEQAMFRRLGVFVGGCTLDAIEDVYCQLKAESQMRRRSDLHISALDSAVSLIDNNLLRQIEGLDGEPRFYMSETLREYALECLTVCHELDLMRRQHAVYFLDLVDAIEPKLHGAEQESCLKRLDADYNNIRAALAWSYASDTKLVLRLASTLWEYWLTRGYLSEGLAWLRNILKRSEMIPLLPVRERAQVLNGAGLLTSVQGDQEAARVFLQESLRLFRELNDQMGEAWALNHLGQTYYYSRQEDLALEAFETSLKLFRSLGANWYIAWVLINLGEASLQREETDRASALLSEARNLFSALSDKRGTAAAIDRLARLALLRQDYMEATTLISKSLHLFEDIGDRFGSAWALHNMGRIEYESGQKRLAVGYLIQSLRLFGTLNDKSGFARTLLRLGKAVRDLHYPEQAAILFGAADSMIVDFGGQMSVSQRDLIDETLTEARTQSDATAWAKGQTLSSEKTLAWILDQSYLIDTK